MLGTKVTLGLCLALTLAGTACKKKAVGDTATAARSPISVGFEGNPFVGVEIFTPAYSHADQARRRLEATSPTDAQLISKIADTPQARWLGEWSGDIETAVRNYVNAAKQKNQVPLFVAYNIPSRDCGQHSAGGAAEATAYQQWISGLALGITREWRAIVVLEPDALGHLTQCLNEQAQKARLAMLRKAVESLQALPGVAVYIDAGHPRWVPAEQMAQRLDAAGVRRARGFALNTSNFIADEELIVYGEGLVALLGGGVHYIIDSSRNGNGPAQADEWCNPPGRALGRPPGPVNDGSALDAFAWLKNPGESDGTCNGGPAAGQWFEERALEMARNAAW